MMVAIKQSGNRGLPRTVLTAMVDGWRGDLQVNYLLLYFGTGYAVCSDGHNQIKIF